MRSVGTAWARLLAFTPEGNLVVDLAHNRVLMYRQPLTNGPGGPDPRPAGRHERGFPVWIGSSRCLWAWWCSFGRLYVADYGNVRIVVFTISTSSWTVDRAVVLATSAGGGHPVHLALHPRTEERTLTRTLRRLIPAPVWCASRR